MTRNINHIGPDSLVVSDSWKVKWQHTLSADTVQWLQGTHKGKQWEATCQTMDAWLCNVYLLELRAVETWMCELQWVWKEAPISCFFLSRHILDGTEENHRNSRFKPGLSEYREEILRTRPRGFPLFARISRAKHITNALRTKYEAVHMEAYLRKQK